MDDIELRQTNAFMRAYKKLHGNQKDAVDKAVENIVSDPTIGAAKKGDLQGVYVYNFECVSQRLLWAYECDSAARLLLLVGTHEIFFIEKLRNRSHP
ncbi:MAG: type II toxin-antitoxin system RelE/ParE family toxin [Mariprofundus sp.]|nr:type II toxin-antitoxin system RelE/ParE family toxin [Mariprofundus sp.]